MVRRPPERLSIAMMALGPVRAALDWTVNYVTQRTAFSRTPSSSLATPVTEAHVLGGPPGQSGPSADRGHADRGRRSQGQALGHRGQHRVLDRCLQLPGGYGYMTEYPIARLYADARVQTMCGGTSEIMKTIIARDVPGLRT